MSKSDLWVRGARQTDTDKHRHTHRHIKTMTPPGLGAKPIENAVENINPKLDTRISFFFFVRVLLILEN